MESSGILTLDKAAATPKALLHQKYGPKAVYRIEEVKESTTSECPGLIIPRQGRNLYRCSLELPGFSVTSGTFTKKKDAEQSAAKMAIEKLGIQPKSCNLTVQEMWDELVVRLSYLFSDEFLLSSHPLVGHLRAALQIEGAHHGLIPATILPICDSRLNNLCKSINPRAETNPCLTLAIVMKAVNLCACVHSSPAEKWVGKRSPHSSEVAQALLNQGPNPTGRIQIEAVYIPCAAAKAVEAVCLNISSNEYYMDVIAQRLGARDCSHVIVSRTIGRASSEMRLYFAVPRCDLLSSDSCKEMLSNSRECMHDASELNARASYLSCQNIYGDAIMTILGYTWKSTNLFHECVSLGLYYRMLIGRTPSGNYKLSREAIFAAELPSSFTTRANWRGSLPRDLLCMFCRQHCLPEPIFSTKVSKPLVRSSSILEIGRRQKLSTNNCEQSGGEAIIDSSGEAIIFSNGEADQLGCNFGCEIKIMSRGKDVIIEYCSDEFFRKQSDSIQNAALKVLNWLNNYFKDLDMSMEKLSLSGDSQGIRVYAPIFCREFALCPYAHNVSRGNLLRCCCSKADSIKKEESGVSLVKIEGSDSGVSPSSGSLACISYSVSLLLDGHSHQSEPLEAKDEFEFEIGAGAVIHQLEACVTQLSVNQTAVFVADIPSQDIVLASVIESSKSLPLSSFETCCLLYTVKLLRVMEPLEDRMEQALFSPPLSKQRLDYALRHICASSARSLIDFGCGSGCLLDSLLEHPTSLEKVVGVDISQKGLCRAAKMLHSKLSMSSTVRSAVLYEGSIIDFDSQLYGFDIGTCLEVIEHMEEDQACLFGDVVLSSFCPQILIVSTPNYEYNSILQKTVLPNREDEAEDNGESQPIKFRNHDHKFEWTRQQFNNWASNLAAKYNYSVEFDGVGGSGDVEPGFASQIAVFWRKANDMKSSSDVEDSSNHYKIIWEWCQNG